MKCQNAMSKANYILTVLIMVIINTGTATAYQCKTSDFCTCTINRATRSFEFYCPLTETKNLTIIVSPLKSYLHIKCQDQNDLNIQKVLPKIPIQQVNTIQFRNCILPKPNFITFTENLGITNVEHIDFQLQKKMEDLKLNFSYFEGLNYLRSLIMSKSFIKDVDNNTFQAMSDLELLDLSNNDILVLQSNLFINLTNIQSLILHSNRLTKLNEKVFENLQNLKNLDLSNNYIEMLPKNLFYDLINLKWLNLINNNIQHLSEEAFMHNPFLEAIELDANVHLKELHSNLFVNLSELKDITLQDCNIESVPEYLFSSTINLRNISLAINEIETLSSQTFKKLKQLQHLDLSYNKLRHLSDNIFSFTMKLLTLNLKNNLLESITKDVFYKLQNLESINLDHNNISSIHMNSFVSMTKLKKVSMANNAYELPKRILFDEVVSPFNANLKLVTLDLSNNHIKYISEDWTRLIHLKELNLSYNRISDINFADISSTSPQITIDLTNNQISTINFNEAEITMEVNDMLQKDVQVYFDVNPISCDCFLNAFVNYYQSKSKYKWIKVIADNLMCANTRLKNNLVKELHPAMLTCSFEQLGIENNCSKECTCEFRPWDKSLIYNCSYRNLRHYPELNFPTTKFYNQTEIHLEGNLLRSVPPPDFGNENVSKMIISYNNIQEVSRFPQNLEVLWLDHNNISYLNESVLNMLNVSRLRELKLGNNPWTCDCSAASFKEFLVARLATLQFDAEEIKCNNTGKPLINTNSSDLCPLYITLIVFLTIIFILIAIITAMLVVLFYRYNHVIKVWLFTHKMCLWYVLEEEHDKDKACDAFISYCSSDEEFVMREFLPVLEKGTYKYKICLQSRDWEVGALLSEQITKSIERSRRTLIILSPAYLESIWGRVEFRLAHKEAMNKENVKVIIIIYGNVDLINSLDDELRAYIRTNTYVKWDDPWFWDKIRYAMPHARIRKRKNCSRIIKELDSEL